MAVSQRTQRSPNYRMIHAMISQNISNYRLADHVGVQDPYIALLRHNRRQPSKELAIRIEKALGERGLFECTSQETVGGCV